MKNYHSINEQVAGHLISFFVQQYVEQDYYHYSNSYPNFIKNMQMKFAVGEFKVDWSLGGTYGHYSGSMDTVEPEMEQDMIEFDQFLMHAYPHTNFMQYKILSQAVEKSTYRDSDYYGGQTTKAQKVLSFVNLSNALMKTKVEPTTATIDSSDLPKMLQETYTQQWFDETFPDTVKKADTKKKNVKIK